MHWLKYKKCEEAGKRHTKLWAILSVSSGCDGRYIVSYSQLFKLRCSLSVYICIKVEVLIILIFNEQFANTNWYTYLPV